MDNVTLNRSLTFKIKGRSYTINFPTVGQLIDIESNKVSLSNGEYGNLIKSGTKGAYDALELIDIRSFLDSLIPSLSVDLGVNNLGEIDAIDFLELTEIYKTEILPWINNWYNLFSQKNEKK